LVAYIRENATVSEKEVSYDDFVEMASKGWAQPWVIQAQIQL
jgi:hypothetical protein